VLLIRKKDQNRRDFTGVYQCEGCQNTQQQGGGYDDSYFHQFVIPEMKCNKCGKSSLDMGTPLQPVKTKYPEWLEV
jgi:ribosomal protein L37AE/L43A